MTNPILARPTPDFAEFERVVKGEQKSQRVHLIELLVDAEVMQHITERYLGVPWIPLEEDTQEPYYKQLVNLYYRLGYDCVNHVVFSGTDRAE